MHPRVPNRSSIINQATLEIQGTSVRYRVPGGARTHEVPPRGPSTSEMTRGKRKRMMRTFNLIDWEALIEQDSRSNCSFLTLSLPQYYWTREERVCKALDLFHKRMIRTLPGYLFCIGRLEFGIKRGAPHFHLVVVGSHLDEKEFFTWARENWTECLGYGSECPKVRKKNGQLQDYVRVEVSEVRSIERVRKYISKYTSKVGYDGAETSSKDTDSQRLSGESLSKVHLTTKYEWSRSPWFVWDRKNVIWASVETIDLSKHRKHYVACSMKRGYRKWLERQYLVSRVKDFRECIGHPREGRPSDWQWRVCRSSIKREQRIERRRARKRRKRGETYQENMPFHEALRRIVPKGYELWMSPEILDALLSLALTNQLDLVFGDAPDVSAINISDI